MIKSISIFSILIYFVLFSSPFLFGQNYIGINAAVFPFSKTEGYATDHFNIGLTYSLKSNKYFSARAGINYVGFKSSFDVDNYYEDGILVNEIGHKTYRRNAYEFPIEGARNIFLKNTETKLFHIIFGLVPSVIYNSDIVTKNRNGQTVELISINKNSWQIGITTGLGYQFNLSNKLDLNIESQFKFFKDKKYSPSVESKSYGVRIQLFYSISRK